MGTSKLSFRKCQLNKLTNEHNDSCSQPRGVTGTRFAFPPKATKVPNQIYETMVLKTVNADHEN